MPPAKITSMTAILIDDEAAPLATLQDYLRKYCPQVQISGIGRSASEAFDLILEKRPDLVFLDIEMPGESGFDLLRKLPSLDFEIIFVTGFDTYGLQAIKFCAIGYVLKPIRTEELITAVNSAQKRIAEKKEFNRNKQLLSNLTNPGHPANRIGIPTERGLEFVETSVIVRCEGLQGYTQVILRDRKSILCSYNLGEFVKLLADYDFYSVHKSHLINLTHIVRYDKEGRIKMTDGAEIPVSRRRRQDFLERLTRL